MKNFDYLYNPDAAKGRFDKNYFPDKKLGFQVIEHGMILPYKDVMFNGKWTWGKGGVVDSKGTFIKSTSPNGYVEDGAYTPPPESIQYRSETVIYLGIFIPIWGHFITSSIRRMWFLNSEFMKEFKNCSFIYLSWNNGNKKLEDQQNFKRLLEILEVDFSRLQSIAQPTQFDKIIIPDSSWVPATGFTTEYRETIDHLRNLSLKNKTPTPSKKVYYFHGHNQVGEERLAQYFKAKGYEIIQPEKLTLDEQLNWLINAESFASTLGSCAHNSVFLRDGTETIIIPREALFGRDYQMILDQVNLLNANYIDSTMSIFDKGNRYHCYIISEQLKRFFGDKWNGYEEEDFKIFLQYVKNSMINGLEIDSREKKYYSSIFPNFMAQLKQRKDLITAADMPPRWETFQPPLRYTAHIANKSWVAWQNENQIIGLTEDKLDIQAIRINFPGHKVYYSVYYNDEEGWSKEVTACKMAGTTGKSKPIYGMRVRLDEDGSKEFDILYRMHKFDGEWTPWAKNGESLYSYGQKLNTIQIKLELVNLQPTKEEIKQPVEVQTFLIENGESIHWQRQDLTQIKF